MSEVWVFEGVRVGGVGKLNDQGRENQEKKRKKDAG